MPADVPRRRRLGVIGTFVWDVIYGQPPHDTRVEGWGGITYALSGLDAALGDDWEIVPVMKVGADRIEAARAFLGTLRRVGPDAELLEVPERNNCSELRYYSEERRSEFLSGGTPGWAWSELEPRLVDAKLDALYVNFLSGWEIDLETARRIRAYFEGPMYVDFHMMAWTALPSGLRTPTPIKSPAEWCACFDFIQVNEDELPMMAPDARALASMASEAGAHCTIVTLGRRGVVYFASPSVTQIVRDPRARSTLNSGVFRTAVLPPDEVREGPGVDPTGCGDVWGSTFFARLLGGADLHGAMREANRAAGRNVEYRGVEGLSAYLSGE